MHASLHILKGPNEGAVIPLDGDSFILGRDPTKCQIHIPIGSVSREHAKIHHTGGQYFIEDNQSRNGTFVNNEAISGRHQLKNNDKIRICDFVTSFLEPSGVGTYEEEPEGEAEDDGSTIESTISQGAHFLLDRQPTEKLRTLLEISANLSKTLELDKLLPKISESLFDLFRQADRCFIIQAEPGVKEGDPPRLIPRVINTRRPLSDSNDRFSRSIVRRCLDTAQAFLTDDAQRDAPLSQSVVDFRIRSVMSVPLCRADGAAFGVIQLDTQDRSKKFTDDDLKLLWGIAHQSSIALENARLLDDAVIQAKLKRDLELAQEIQLSFLPKEVPKVEGYEFANYYQAAQAVGGDYFGYIPMPDGRMTIALGDVAGKGIPAALLMAKLSSDTRFCFLTEQHPGLAVAELNDLLYEFTSRADRFVTASIAILNPSTHEVTLVSAGHPSPYLCRANPREVKEVVPHETSGPPLGIAEGIPFDICKIQLEPGDSLLLFSDGVTDPEDQQGNDFGTIGIVKTLESLPSANPEALVEGIVSAVTTYSAGSPQFDDITLISFGRLPLS